MKKIFEYQHWHVISLLILLAVIFFFTDFRQTNLTGECLGIKTQTWFVIAILCPIIHQLYVLIFWRAELYYKKLSSVFKDYAFVIFKLDFAMLFASRLVSIIFLALASRDSLAIGDVSSNILAIGFLIPAIYLFYSVRMYFGFDRAVGIDHFYPEKFKGVPFVRRGIFKYSSNAMYVFGFFILYVPGILLKSEAALIVAGFNHLYIWVHYYFTEVPDMKYIYQR